MRKRGSTSLRSSLDNSIRSTKLSKCVACGKLFNIQEACTVACLECQRRLIADEAMRVGGGNVRHDGASGDDV